MATALVYAGAVAPEGIEIQISSTSAILDLLTVTAVSLAVTLPSGTATTWTATITAQTATLLTVTHTFDALGAEVATVGTYTIVPKLTVPTGVRRAAPVRMPVTATA